ncbi:hypothetical protein J3L16_03650 [Alteromonas sp. 5E99-2]|uniref:hypothetical protein n=1 Tax=Alteromonas sp. 5E99-2 TaxID=2817683 RepID=UPI001A98E089|nr:hypothetical protein [Alteromonas sp. 5E99-2]MBO1254781.1 hypothetical protein [Alteromonas sp. 5E99-2]
MQFQKKIRQIHKIVGAVVAIQLLMWMISGLYMTAVPIQTIRGQHLVSEPPAHAITNINVIPMSELIKQYSGIQSISLKSRLRTPIYSIETTDSTFHLNAITGTKLPKITETEAKHLALSAYKGDGQLRLLKLVTTRQQAPDTSGRALPLWKAEFDDTFNTRLYISVVMGKVVAVRTDLWRIFDFLWMLHIMDYEERENFNNPVVIFMASLGLFTVLSGLILVVNTVRKRGLKGLTY